MWFVFFLDSPEDFEGFQDESAALRHAKTISAFTATTVAVSHAEDDVDCDDSEIVAIFYDGTEFPRKEPASD